MITGFVLLFLGIIDKRVPLGSLGGSLVIISQLISTMYVCKLAVNKYGHSLVAYRFKQLFRSKEED
jgi:hypothetical protein